MSMTLGYSPCPNDTFIFYGLVHSKIAGAPVCEEILEDIETLNTLALRGALDLTKISFHALAHLREKYCLLHSGGALGRGCGPLVVSSRAVAPDELKDKKIAIPGQLTTAALLLRLFDTGIEHLQVMPFDQIMGATARGEVDAGVIIHESRFTYPEYGLKKVVDLGEWWEQSTGHPIPLGGILARRSLGTDQVGCIDKALKESIEYAYANPDVVRGYIRQHAQEMDEEVMQAHIDLYVNEFSLDYGQDGKAAIFDLIDRAERAGIAPKAEAPLFVC